MSLFQPDPPGGLDDEAGAGTPIIRAPRMWGPTVPSLIAPDFLSADRREVAAAFALEGLAVFPLWGMQRKKDGSLVCACPGEDPSTGRLCSPGKHPKVGFKEKAVADLEAFWEAMQDDYWHKSSNNFAMATGSASGVGVVDLDGPRAEVSWAADCEAFGQPDPTWEVISGRLDGGRHLYFRLDPELPRIGNRAGTLLGLGVDFRGEGGYVGMPRNVHPSGSVYGWREGHNPTLVEMATLPRAMHLHLATSSPAPSAPRQRAGGGASVPGAAPVHRTSGSDKFGDGPDGGNFDRPTYVWACRYFVELGPDAPAEPLLEALTKAISEAPRAPGRSVARYLSPAYLAHRIAQAREFARRVRKESAE